MPDAEPQQITSFAKAVAAAQQAGGQWFFDEYLYRGQPNGQNGGQYKGSHVVVGIDYVDPFGDRQTKLYPPMPVGDLPGQVPLSLIFPEAAVAMQRELDARAATITAHETTIAQQAASIESLTASLASANSKLSAVASTIA